MTQASPEQTLERICQALQEQQAAEFVRDTVKTGYRELFGEWGETAASLGDQALDNLVESQQDSISTDRLKRVSAHLVESTFRKGDSQFWFNRLYHEYKTVTKPEADFQQLSHMVTGPRVLDYGCGSGYLSARLARGGYQVFATDVLDYRYDEARHLPFALMRSPSDTPWPEDSADTALVQAVLHHVGVDDLPQVLQGLARVARHAVIKEDTYDLPPDLPLLADLLPTQPLLHRFVHLPKLVQFNALILIDFYANVIAQGIGEMNLPFAFRSVPEWGASLSANGWDVTEVRLAGFERGRMHKSCHVWLLCRRKA